MRMLTLVVIIGLLFAHAGKQGQRAGQGGRRNIVVEVVNVSAARAVIGARVWVVNDAWKELASGVTDQVGEARLSVPTDGERPKYVLAERENYYLAGRPWHDGYGRFYIQTTLIPLFQRRQ